MTPSGHFVLSDFDLSHPDVSGGLESGAEYADLPLEHRFGTCPYMAPELLELHCEPSERVSKGLPRPTQRSDMWSLGMTLLQFALMLDTVRPFIPLESINAP